MCKGITRSEEGGGKKNTFDRTSKRLPVASASASAGGGEEQIEADPEAERVFEDGHSWTVGHGPKRTIVRTLQYLVSPQFNPGNSACEIWRVRTKFL